MEINLNQVPEGSTLFRNSEYNPSKTVKMISPSCSCMTASYDSENKMIRMSYKANKLNQQVLSNQGYQEIYKFLTVYFTDNTTEKINIKGKIVKS